MKTQYTLIPVTRWLLVLTGLAGLASLMFFKDVSPLTNWLALVTIIPLVMGMLGENLVREFFVTTFHTLAGKEALTHEITGSIRATILLPPGMADRMEKGTA